jgi:hypothetical protein
MKIVKLLTQLSRTFVEVSLFYNPLAWRKPDEVDSRKNCGVSVNNRDEVGVEKRLFGDEEGDSDANESPIPLMRASIWQ